MSRQALWPNRTVRPRIISPGKVQTPSLMAITLKRPVTG